MRGADDAILLNDRGRIAEASAANLFMVRGDTLLTPPVREGALEGVTRETILELASAEGIANRETTLTRSELTAADEAFLTGTGARLVPVRSVDGADLAGPIPGPVTRRLDSAFRALVSREP